MESEVVKREVGGVVGGRWKEYGLPGRQAVPSAKFQLKLGVENQ